MPPPRHPRPQSILMDRQVAGICRTFVEKHRLGLQTARRNFALHMSTLCDFGVLAPADMLDILRLLDRPTSPMHDA